MQAKPYEIMLKYYEKEKTGRIIIKEGIVKYCNHAFSRIIKNAEENQSAKDIFPEEFYNKFVLSLKDYDERAECVELFGKTLDVHVFTVDDNIVMSVEDIDAVSAKLRRDEESFKALKTAYGRLVNAVTVIDAAAELTVKNYAAELPGPVQLWLKRINQSVVDMTDAVMDVMEIVETGSENADKGCRPEDVRACVSEAIEIMQPSFDSRKVKLVSEMPEGNIAFPLNRKSVIHMLMRLLSHELEGAEEGKRVVISVSLTEESIEFSVRDAFRREQEEHIEFLKNPTLEDMDRILEKYGNNLYLVHRLVAFYDGQMSVENINKGKRVSVKLPYTQVLPYIQQREGEPLRMRRVNWPELI